MKGAVISGRAGVAVYGDGEKLLCVRPGSSPQVTSPGMLPFLFDGDGEYHPDATLESTITGLDLAFRQERGLQLALISMDPVSDVETRELAEEALEDFLSDEEVRVFIVNRLYSHPMPDIVSWAANKESVFSGVAWLKISVVVSQEAVRLVRQEWDSLPEEFFAEPGDREVLDEALTRFGAFRVLVEAVEAVARGEKSWAYVMNTIVFDRRYEVVANSETILREWIKRIAPRSWDQPVRRSA